MIKPLNRIKGMNTMPEAVLNRRPKNQKIQASLRPKTPQTPQDPASQQGSIVAHSSQAQRQSEHYHKNIVAAHTGGRQSSARITDQLNPDRSVSANSRTKGRRFPGL
jgi:hypothetical protein